MAISDIISVSMRQEWFVGDVRTYQGPTETSTGPFTHSITLDPNIPYVERVNFFAQPTATDGTEDGVYYGGVYKPDINGISITGTGLSASQIQSIRSALTYNVSPAAGGEDLFSLNISPVAAAGCGVFSIAIPYEETVVINNSGLIEIPFIVMVATDDSVDPTTVTIDQDNGKIIIDAGLEDSEFPALRITNIANGRDISLATAQKSSGDFTVTWEEDISDRAVLVVDNNNPLQPIEYGSYRYALNYRYLAQVSGTDLTLTVASKAGKSLVGSAAIEDIDSFLEINTGRGISGSITVSSNDTLDVSFTCSGGASALMNFVYLQSAYSQVHEPVTLTLAGSYIEVSGIGYRSNGSIGPVSSRRSVTADTTISSAFLIIGEVCLDMAQYGIECSPVFSDVTEVLYNAMYIDVDHGSVTAQHLGTSSYLTYTPPDLAVARTESYDLSRYTLNELRSLLYSHFEGYPFQFSISQYLQDAEWLDATAQILADYSGGFGTSSSADAAQSISIDAGGEFFSTTTVYDLTAYATLTLLSEQIQDDYAEIDVVCSPGLHYEASDPTEYLLTGYDSGTINSLVDVPDFLSINAGSGSTVEDSYSVTLDGSVTMSDLVTDLNTNLSGLFFASLVSNTYAETDADDLQDEGPLTITSIGSQSIFDIAFSTHIIREYSFSVYTTLLSLVSAINSYWISRGITASVAEQSEDYPSEAIPSNLRDNTADGGINVHDATTYFAGLVREVSDPTVPFETVTYSFNVRFASDTTPNSDAGIQVALGGYESDGTFFPNESPNTFYEPGFNTFFPISFSVLNADIIYLLVRTRQNLDGDVFTSEVSDYSGLARFNNGFPSQTLLPIIPAETKFTSVWTEDDLGDPASAQVPVMLSISASSNVIDVIIDENEARDSVHLVINNSADVLDEFGFLAINRSNPGGSMTASRNGRVFGMALDNRGIWDVLIGPEAELAKVSSGDFSHLGSSYQRTLLDADEAYDFELNSPSTMPDEVRSAVSLIPIPGYPQVWILRIERGVKQYLASLREDVSRLSQDGCSVDIDIAVTGRNTGVEGICRVTVFYDVYCVFDTGLCDAFWNLSDPPEPSGPPLIQEQLEFAYQSLIDCDRLEFDADDSNTEISVPILCSIRNIPMFRNGNACLLLKSFYTAEIQGFYFPLGDELANLVFEDCSAVGSNLPLISALNKTLLYLPNDINPVTDPIEIESLLETEESYLHVKIGFQFPSNDPQKDCGEDEVIIAALGYQFKNWSSGLREDNILFGVNMIIPGGVYVSPEMQFCYKYYYDQQGA